MRSLGVWRKVTGKQIHLCKKNLSVVRCFSMSPLHEQATGKFTDDTKAVLPPTPFTLEGLAHGITSSQSSQARTN